MRDRLIELIREARKNMKSANSDLHREYIFADYLLENGVIVPPCKVGEDIWVSTIMKDKVYKTKAVGFSYDVITDPYNAIPFSDVSTTKEEAEKALKGGVQE